MTVGLIVDKENEKRKTREREKERERGEKILLELSVYYI